jgi:hypothetical protein
MTKCFTVSSERRLIFSTIGRKVVSKTSMLVFGVIDDPGDLLRVEARVDVCSTAPMPIAPYQVAMWRSVFQPSVATRSPRPMPSSFRAVETCLAAAGDDLAVAVLQARVLEDLVHGQRPVLHDAFHLVFPPGGRGSRGGGACDFSMPCLCGQMR